MKKLLDTLNFVSNLIIVLVFVICVYGWFNDIPDTAIYVCCKNTKPIQF